MIKYLRSPRLEKFGQSDLKSEVLLSPVQEQHWCLQCIIRGLSSAPPVPSGTGKLRWLKGGL